MTTPTSTATTPSPPMAFLHANPVSVVAAMGSGGIDATEREARQRAIQKFLARAEISKLTRGLRARLSYATYKAKHDVARLPISELESRAGSGVLATWTPSARNYNDSPVIQGNSITNTSGGSVRKGVMAPPAIIPSSTPRIRQASPGKRESASANAAQSLYASILAPPPAKRARTIHNPEDPPVPAPARMTNGTSRHRKQHTRANTRTGKETKRKEASKGGRTSGQHRDVKASNADRSQDVDVDMKAAATLTHLLRHSRSSITSLGAVSPRSSLSAGSDVGSSHSLSQFAQSSARTATTQTSLTLSQESPQAGSLARPATPPRGSDARLTSRTGSHPDGGSASASATDQEAIKLLYFLHESPSPARPSTVRNRDSQDVAPFGTLSKNPAQGRVLFPTASGGPSDMPSAHRMLTRDNSSSSVSSSVLMEIPNSRTIKREPTLVIEPPVGDVVLPQHTVPANSARKDAEIAPITKITPPTPIEPSPSQLLPAPSSPQRAAQ
ncbi:hypothetical protein EDB89DRAFT_1880796, partial [Lactarius sanguifluus]